MKRLRRLQILAITAIILTSAWSTTRAAQNPSNQPDHVFDRLMFRSIGPANMGGRVDDFAVLEKHPATFFAGSATGGLWKTVNNGTTWEPVFDNQDVVSIGAVAIPADSASLVWVGTGEANNRQSSSWGGGVFKSTDGGRTWKNMGLPESRHAGRIVIDPIDHDIVYVAAGGHLWGPNRERGVYKTSDGGLTWTQSLFVDENTGATDIVIDPANNKVLYAAMYQRQRSAWGFNGGGPGSGLFKSMDAGRTWTKLTNGIPAGPLGRIGIDVYRRDPNVVYALIQHEQESGLFRSDDAGAHWTKMSNQNPRPLYFSQVRIDPNDDHRIYVLGVRLNVSDDRGKTFSEVRVAPVRSGGDRTRDDMDVHAMWVDPNDSAHLIVGADVGVATSYDRGASWDYIDSLPLGQFYHVGYDLDTPYNVYGGLQDNDVWAGPSAVRNRFGIANRDWTTLAIGDGFVAIADPHDSRTIYGETQDGNVVRIDRETNERKSIKPQAAQGEILRWAWDTPLILSPHDSNTILIGANKVFRSRDRGQSWETISPDLTSAVDRETLTMMGVAGKDIKIGKNDGVASYPTIVALAESPKKAGIYYAGSDDGTVNVSRDGGKTWTNISTRFPGLPPRAAAARFVASSFDEATAFATFNNHRSDDHNAYVYMTADYGNTWASLASSLPKGQTVNCITEDPKNPNVLYLGTEFGLFVTLDKGRRWIRLKNNLPTVPIDEITIHPRENDMLLATHGRSIWILDDISPIQQAAEAMKTSAFLFETRPAVEFNPSGDFASYHGDRRFWGQNPEFGAAITYYLNEGAKNVKITIRDAAGSVVRELSNDDLKNAHDTGINRTYWDLRHQPVEALRVRPQGTNAPVAPGGFGGGFGGGGGVSPGPFVMPGEYRLTLSVEGRDIGTRPQRVQGDPLIRITDADRKTQHDTALALHELLRSMNDAASAAVSAIDQVRSLQELLKLVANPPAAAKTAADTLDKRLSAIGQQLGVQGLLGGGQTLRTQVNGAKTQIMGSTSLPTASQMQSARESREAYVKLVADLNDALTVAMPSLYKTMSDNGVRPAAMKEISPVKVVSPPG